MNIRTVKYYMAGMALIAFVIAVSSAYQQATLLAITNFAATLFFVFLYENPAILLARSMGELDEAMEDVKDRFLLWNSIAIALCGVGFALYAQFGLPGRGRRQSGWPGRRPPGRAEPSGRLCAHHAGRAGPS